MWQYGITLLQYLRSSELQAGWNVLKGVPGCKEPAGRFLKQRQLPIQVVGICWFLLQIGVFGRLVLKGICCFI